MLRLARPLLTFVVPALALAACGDNLVGPAVGGEGDAPDPGQPVEGLDGEPKTPSNLPAIQGEVYLDTPSCDAPVAAFEAYATYVEGGGPAPARCRVTFDDGAVYDTCVGEHAFAAAGVHTVTVDLEDTLTGARAQALATRNIPPGLEVELEASAPACGLSITFAGSVNVGAFTVVDISPAANVVGPDGYQLTRSNTVTVSAPGTYQVRLTAEDERASGPICVAEVTRTVEVVACPPEDPDHCGCPHCPH